jgi:hypothetical protein
MSRPAGELLPSSPTCRTSRQPPEAVQAESLPPRGESATILRPLCRSRRAAREVKRHRGVAGFMLRRYGFPPQGDARHQRLRLNRTRILPRAGAGNRRRRRNQGERVGLIVPAAAPSRTGSYSTGRCGRSTAVVTARHRRHRRRSGHSQESVPPDYPFGYRQARQALQTSPPNGTKE